MAKQIDNEELLLDDKQAEEIVDELDDAVDEEILKQDTEIEHQPEYRFSQQELIRLKADFDSDDPEISAQAKNIVCQNYKGLINFVCQRYYSTYLPKYYEDFMQQGYLGILQGFKRYKVDVNGVFYQPSTYLTREIRHAVREFIAEYINSASLATQSVGRQILEIIRRKKMYGEDITPGDLATELQISLTTATNAIEILKANAGKVSLEQTVQDGDTKIMDLTPSNTKTPEAQVIEKEQSETLLKAMQASLSPQQYRALLHAYGFIDGEPKSMAKISEILNIPVEKVRSLLASARTRLSQYLISSGKLLEERRMRSQMQNSYTGKRSPDDLQREIDSFDFGSLGDISL